MTVDHGMNIDEVRALADQVARTATRIRDHARTLDRIVARTHWAGPVGSRFKSQWWPQHRSNLLRLAGDLENFAAQARRDAAQQEQASGGAGASSGPSAAHGPEIDWRQTYDKSLFFGSKIVDVESLVRDFNGIKKLAGWSDLFAVTGKVKIGPLAAIGIGTNLFGLSEQVLAGNGEGMIRKGIDVGFDGVGLAMPQVALAKTAWDLGYEVGKGVDWLFGEKLGGHDSFINSVVQNSYGGTITPSSDLGQRYDGWSGFGTWVGDNAANTGNAVSTLWRRVF